MKVLVVPGPGVSFQQFTLEVLPQNTVAEMVSLISIRHNHLDPLLLRATLKGTSLDEKLTVYDAGVRDEDTVQILPMAGRTCCLLL